MVCFNPPPKGEGTQVYVPHRKAGRPAGRARAETVKFWKRVKFFGDHFPLKKLIIHRRNRYHRACSQIKLDKLQNYQQIFSFQNFWNFQKYWSAPHCKINPDTSPTVTQCVKSNTRKMRLMILIATISKTYFLFCLTCLLIIDQWELWSNLSEEYAVVFRTKCFSSLPKHFKQFPLMYLPAISLEWFL